VISDGTTDVSCTTSPCSARFAIGASITLTAGPKMGKAFDEWQFAPCNTTMNPCSFTLTADVTTQAKFKDAP
jgi:hypothetical protein